MAGEAFRFRRFFQRCHLVFQSDADLVIRCCVVMPFLVNRPGRETIDSVDRHRMNVVMSGFFVVQRHPRGGEQ